MEDAHQLIRGAEATRPVAGTTGSAAVGPTGTAAHHGLDPDHVGLAGRAAAAFACGRPKEARRLLRDTGISTTEDPVARVSSVLLATFAGRSSPRQVDLAAYGEVAGQLVEWGQCLTAFSVLVAAEPATSVRDAARRLAMSRPADCGLAAVVALHERDFTSALPLLNEAAYQAEESGQHAVLAHLQTLIGELCLQLGTHGAVQRMLSDAIELSEASAQPLWQARAATALATRSVLCEAPDTEHQVRFAHHLAISASPALCDRAELLEATALAADDRWSDAYAVLRRLARRGPQQVTHLLSAGLLSTLADSAAHIGQHVEARELISCIASADNHCERDIELAELLYATAVLGEASTAETCFRVALSMNPHRLPWHRARTSLAFGHWLRRARRVTESRSYLLDALRIFEALELPVWVRRTQAELRASGVRTSGTSGRSDRSLALSPQELEVATLVARGLTNRQIGEALHVSPRTVGSHLYRIFPKLDLTSRNELAALLG